MDLGDYHVVPSAKFNSGQFRSALAQRMNTELLFPIYRTISGSGSTAEYEVIGWVGFVIEEVTGGGSNATLHGYFTRVVWEGLRDDRAFRRLRRPFNRAHRMSHDQEERNLTMTYRLRNILLAVVPAVLAAFLTALYVANYQNRVDAGQEKVKVFVAKSASRRARRRPTCAPRSRRRRSCARTWSRSPSRTWTT